MVVANTFATDTRVRREAKALAGEGIDVHVLCWDRLGRQLPTETIDGCSVRNVKLGKTTVLASARLYYVIAALLFQAVVFLSVVKQIRKAQTFILHAHDFNVLVGCAIATKLLRGRVRLVYDCHELTPGVYREWYGSAISKIVSSLEFVMLSCVDGLLTANDAILSHLQPALEESTPATAVYTCPSISDVQRALTLERMEAKRKLGMYGIFVVLFSGRVRQDYDLEIILETARNLKENSVTDFRFVFTGPPETMKLLMGAVVKERLQGLFDFRGWVPDEDLLTYYVASDLCFVVTRNIGPNTRILTPIKLFEAMACGVPVIVRDGTLAARIVRDWECGAVLDATETSFWAELMAFRHNPDMVRGFGEAGREAFHRVYNWDQMQARLLQLYAKLWT
jgi:glycosyltransferase involved in cell wall biosynthesis